VTCARSPISHTSLALSRCGARNLRARGYSPNTLSAYSYDLLHFMFFLNRQQLTYLEFTPPHALLFLEYLSTMPSRKQAQRLGPVLSTTTDEGSSTTCLSPPTINRIFAAVSSFYEYGSIQTLVTPGAR
jgi:site-specific recombinase XerD